MDCDVIRLSCRSIFLFFSLLVGVFLDVDTFIRVQQEISIESVRLDVCVRLFAFLICFSFISGLALLIYDSGLDALGSQPKKKTGIWNPVNNMMLHKGGVRGRAIALA